VLSVPTFSLVMITMTEAMDKEGNPIEGYDEEIPFMTSIKGQESIKAVTEALALLKRKNLLANPVQVHPWGYHPSLAYRR
jgi:hypothetical protein